MSGIISPLESNLVMTQLACSSLDTGVMDISFYVRYVDHILIIIRNKDVQELLSALNAYHPRIQFIIVGEQQQNYFFYMSLINSYHKPTFSEKTINFKSENSC